MIQLAVEDRDVVEASASMIETLGFLTIVHETNGYSGGYLVTNLWGRPLEFRLTTAVQPNRIQQILYAGTLQSYLCSELIGKTLVDKTSAAAQCIFTDCEPVLDLRLRIEVPVACLEVDSSSDSRFKPGASSQSGTGDSKWPVHCHPRFPADAAMIRQLLDRLAGDLDLAEPFLRIRQAMSEARKLGVVSRN
jgi:hypothetical protein